MIGFLNNARTLQVASYFRRAPNLVSNLPRDYDSMFSTATFMEFHSPLSVEMSNVSSETVRDFTREELKAAIVELFETRGTLYPSDIVFALDVDYDQVNEILRELQEEGAVRPAEKP